MLETWMFLPAQAVAQVATDLPVRLLHPDGDATLTFAEALARLSGPWCLVLPAEAVTSCGVTLPTQRQRWLRKALPFAVEEWLAEEVEAFHLALGERLEDGRQRVHAVRRDWLQAWLDTCGAQPPREIRIDADLLPRDGAQLCRLDERWLLGGAIDWRLALDGDDWPALRQRLAETPVAHLTEGQQPLEGCATRRVDDPWRWLVGNPVGCNLAQGDFAVREPVGHWQRWRPVAAALGACLLLQWGFGLAQGWQLRHAARMQAEASEQLYRELFPEDRRLIDLRRQLDQHLAAGAADHAGLLALLGRAGAALAADDAPVRLQQLDFSLTRGDLALQVQAPGFEALDGLRQRLVEAGLSVQVGSASREESGVSARLVIGG